MHNFQTAEKNPSHSAWGGAPAPGAPPRAYVTTPSVHCCCCCCSWPL